LAPFFGERCFFSEELVRAARELEQYELRLALFERCLTSVVSEESVRMMSTRTEPPPASQEAKEAKKIKSMFITDGRREYDEGTMSYLYEFDESMVPGRVWEALMVLEEKGMFHFPHVEDYDYHALIDNVKDRQKKDADFRWFFESAMEEEHEWPRKESGREENMKQLGGCSWVVNLVEA